MNDSKNEEQPKKPGALAVVLSTVAAAFGVQSEKNRQRDFTGGSIKTFIIAGVSFTVIFVLAVALIVKLVLSNIGT